MANGHVTREQLAMVSVLMSRQASRHPSAMTQCSRTLQDVLDAPSVGLATSQLECARRADGGAALIVASSDFMDEYLGHDRMSSRDGTPAPTLGAAAADGGTPLASGLDGRADSSPLVDERVDTKLADAAGSAPG